MAKLDIIGSDETIFYSLYLLISFLFASNFKQVFPINQKIALFLFSALLKKVLQNP